MKQHWHNQIDSLETGPKLILWLLAIFTLYTTSAHSHTYTNYRSGSCAVTHTLLAADAVDESDRHTSDSDEEAAALPLAPAGSLRPGIVHRLDKGTTGQSTSMQHTPSSIDSSLSCFQATAAGIAAWSLLCPSVRQQQQAAIATA